MSDIPAVTAGQMREVDRLLVEEYGLDLVRMMENAGRALAQVAIARFAPTSVVVLVGSGGNGGGGLVVARHLANRGVAVTVVLARPDLSGVPGHQLRILSHLPVTISFDPVPAGLVVDALNGYSVEGAPRRRAAELIAWANAQSAPVLALDVPSGLDPTLGVPAGRCVSATLTLTLALPKTGLLTAAQVGELFVADIGIPPGAYRQFGIAAEGVFDRADIVGVPTATLPHPPGLPAVWAHH